MKDLPQLDQMERLELENIMLRMALESEKLAKYEMLHSESKKAMDQYQKKLETWNKKYEAKLKPLGVTMADIGIDAETGKVFPLRPDVEQPQKVD